MRLSPLPVDAAIDLDDERAYFHFFRLRAVEVRLTKQRPREQDRGVDGGELAVFEALPGLHVQKVVEKALVPGRASRIRTLRSIAKKTQGREHALPCRRASDIRALDTDGVTREREANRCDTGERRGRITVGHQAVLRIGGVREE